MRWKWILAAAAAVVLGGLIVIYIIIASYDFNKLKPQITSLAKEYTGRDLTLAGDIKLGIGLSPRLRIENVSFQNATWGSRPELVKVERLDIQVELLPLIGGDIQVKHLILLNPDILVETDKSGKSNLAFDVPGDKEPKPDTKESKDAVPAQFAFNRISIKSGKIMLHDHQTGGKHLIGLDQFDLQAPEFGASADMVFNGIYNDIPVKASGKLGPLSGVLDPAEAWPFELKVQAIESSIEIAGLFQDPMGVKGIDVKLSAEGRDLGNFRKITGAPLPIQGPFQASGHLVAPDVNTITLDNFKIVLGANSISGTTAVNLSSEKPEITLNLTSERLDLRPVLAQQEKKSTAGKKEPAQDPKKMGKVFPATPLPLDGLNAANASVDIDIKQLLLPKNAMDNLKTKISLKNGHLMVKPFLANIGGGKLSAEINLRAKANTATIESKVDVDQVDLGKMLKELEITEALDGRLDFDVNLKGRGNSVAAIMAGLNGDVIAILSEGQMPMQYLNIVGADITNSLLKMVNPFEKKIDRAQINCAVCDFNIKDGLAKSDVIIIDDPEKTLLSAGTVNFKTEELDFGIYTRPKEGLGTKETGKVSLSLSAITKPFKLGGTLANPSLGISPERAAKTVGSALIGPGSLASLFVSVSSGEENPCATALEIVAKGPAASKADDTKKKEVKTSVEKKAKGVGNKILDVFKKKR